MPGPLRVGMQQTHTRGTRRPRSPVQVYPEFVKKFTKVGATKPVAPHEPADPGQVLYFQQFLAPAILDPLAPRDLYCQQPVV